MSRIRFHIYVLLFYTVLTVVTTYPQIRYMKQGVYVLSDQLFYGWMIGRNIDSIQHKPLGEFFNATIFYPYENTIAFGDHLLGETLFAVPFYFVSQNPIFAENALILLSFILSAYGAYLLVHYFTKNQWVGTVAGVLFSFSHVRFNQYDHLNILSTEFLPFIFLYLHKFLVEGKRKYLILLSILYVLASLFTIYYFLMISLAVSFYILVYIGVNKISFKEAFSRLVPLGISLIIGVLILLPTLLPYVKFAKEFPQVKRVIQDNITYSASLVSYLSPSKTAISSRILGNSQLSEADAGLFPGYAILILFLISIIYMMKSKFKKERVIFLLLSGIFFILSLGPFLKCTPSIQSQLPLPYFYLYYLLPPLQIMRVPARFAIFMQLFLVLFVSYGLSHIWQKYEQSYKKYLVLAVLVLVTVIDTYSLPFPLTLVETRTDFPPVYSWLKDQPKDTIVLELPIPTRPALTGEDRHGNRHAFMENLSILDRDDVEAYRNYFSLYHKKRMVNGYSAFTPPIYNELVEQTANFPDDRSLYSIKKSQINYVLVHLKQFSEDRQKEIITNLPLLSGIRVEKQFGQDYVVKIL